jgi:hypothetical protein
MIRIRCLKNCRGRPTTVAFLPRRSVARREPWFSEQAHKPTRRAVGEASQYQSLPGRRLWAGSDLAPCVARGRLKREDLPPIIGVAAMWLYAAAHRPPCSVIGKTSAIFGVDGRFSALCRSRGEPSRRGATGTRTDLALLRSEASRSCEWRVKSGVWHHPALASGATFPVC